jgi:hypothetical protein
VRYHAGLTEPLASSHYARGKGVRPELIPCPASCFIHGCFLCPILAESDESGGRLFELWLAAFNLEIRIV